jgi:hypothetical protein
VVSALLLAQAAKGATMPADAYRFAYAAIIIIDRHLTNGTRHYRDWNGRLLTTLEQVVRALLVGELA